MIIRCIWEHNGEDSLLYAENFPGAFTRGEGKEACLRKMPEEAAAYLWWAGEPVPAALMPEIVFEKASQLNIRDADSDVLFPSEREGLTTGEYARLKGLALKSAADFLTLFRSVPDPDKTALPPRETFYGPVPRTAREMYEHTKNVNSYYFSEIDLPADNEGDILSCRERGFALLEQRSDFLAAKVFSGSYGEDWSLRKVLRRFIWHDRIHAKAMVRMTERAFGPGTASRVFRFDSLMTGGR